MYEEFKIEEINKLLEDIPEEKWFRHEELIKEGIRRFLGKWINNLGGRNNGR